MTAATSACCSSPATASTPTTDQYYFVPYEGSHEQLEQTGLPEAAIRDTLGRMRGKALFFVDTCFGGNVVGNFATASRELARMANDLAAAENGVVVFASSSGKQLSEENDPWGNGAFTKAVLAGLSGGADLTRTGRITFKGLDFYVSEEVQAHRRPADAGDDLADRRARLRDRAVGDDLTADGFPTVRHRRTCVNGTTCQTFYDPGIQQGGTGCRDHCHRTPPGAPSPNCLSSAASMPWWTPPSPG